MNTAHNGYLEVYLSLGIVGLTLLVGFLFSGYVRVAQRYIYDPLLGSFGLAIWAILLFYNVTESAFRLQVVWVVFLILAITLADPVPHQRRTSAQRPNAWETTIVLDALCRRPNGIASPTPSGRSNVTGHWKLTDFGRNY